MTDKEKTALFPDCTVEEIRAAVRELDRDVPVTPETLNKAVTEYLALKAADQVIRILFTPAADPIKVIAVGMTTALAAGITIGRKQMLGEMLENSVANDNPDKR